MKRVFSDLLASFSTVIVLAFALHFIYPIQSTAIYAYLLSLSTPPVLLGISGFILSLIFKPFSINRVSLKAIIVDSFIYSFFLLVLVIIGTLITVAVLGMSYQFILTRFLVLWLVLFLICGLPKSFRVIFKNLLKS